MACLIYETHATSIDNEAGLASGWFDCGLSPTGERQAGELGARHPRVERVYCSDLKRAYRTAEIAFAGRSVNITRDARLRECDYGDWTRHATTQIEPERLNRIEEPFSNGESYNQAVARTIAAIGEILARASGPALVIGHRATFFAIEHYFHKSSLKKIIGAQWQWQPGWIYE